MRVWRAGLVALIVALSAMAGEARAQGAPPPAPVRSAPLPPVEAPPAPVAPAPAPPAAAAPQAPVVSAQPGEIAVEARSLGRTANDVEVDEVTLQPIPVILLAVRGRTEQVNEVMIAGFRDLTASMARAGLRPIGQPLTVYLQLGDTDFAAELMLPVAELPASPPPGLRMGRSPAGRAVRVVHAGPYETLDETYEELSTFIEDRGIEVRETVIERYMNDPATTASTDLLTEIYVLKR